MDAHTSTESTAHWDGAAKAIAIAIEAVVDGDNDILHGGDADGETLAKHTESSKVAAAAETAAADSIAHTSAFGKSGGSQAPVPERPSTLAEARKASHTPEAVDD